MDISILEEAGFSAAEAKVYLALLELGISSAGVILDKSGVQNSVLHMTLHKLEKKGFVSYVQKGKRKQYRAADPKVLLAFLEEKKKHVEEIMPQLLVLQQKQEVQEAEVFIGLNGLKTVLYSMIEDAKPGEEYLFFSFYPKNLEEFKYLFDFYREFEKERVRRGIRVRGIAPKAIRHLFTGRQIKNIRYVDQPIMTNITVFRDNVLFNPWEHGSMVSFLIKSSQLATSFRSYFYSIWKK